jgi:hypothetical protein
MLRWVLGGVVCLVVGGMLVNRYFTGIPALEQLTPVEGMVTAADQETRRSRRSQSQVLVVRVGDAAPAYYLERFPEFDRVVGAVKPGDRVSARVDVGGDNYIWQLDRGGDRVVSYAQVAEAQRENDRGLGLFGVLFLVVGVGVLVAMLLQWRAGTSPAAPGAEG